MSDLQLTGIVKRYGSQAVVDNLDLTVAAGEFVSLLGPSGCGKTTLLRMIAGLASPDAGQIRVDGVDITHVPAHKRNIGVVFQNYALFPHLSVFENVAFGLKARSMPVGQIRETVMQALGSVRLEALADRPIAALSGGQQQRVAVARAVATRPRLLLLDEPLSALDRKLRETMQVELRELLREAGMTAIFVTHDQEEALVMSDRIAVMNQGRIEQLDTPERLYATPRTLFSLNFVGLSMQLPGSVSQRAPEGGVIETTCGVVRVDARVLSDATVGDSVVVGVRPESVSVVAAGEPAGGSPLPSDMNQVRARVRQSIYRGTNRLVYFDAEASTDCHLLAELPGKEAAMPIGSDEGVLLRWKVKDTLLFPRSVGEKG